MRLTTTKLALLLFLACASFANAAIARDGTVAVGATSGTFSATATGDLKLVYAFRSSSATPPTLPAGWTQIGTVSIAATASAILGCNVSSSNADTSTGTWTNSTRLVGLSYSGTGVGTTANCNTTGIGGTPATNTGTSTTLDYPAVTMTISTGTSWVVGFVGASQLPCIPSGLTQEAVTGATVSASAADTNAGVTAWADHTCTITSGNWLTFMVEVLAPASGGSHATGCVFVICE